MFYIALDHFQYSALKLYFYGVLDNAANSVCRKLGFLLNLGFRASLLVASRAEHEHTADRSHNHRKDCNCTDHLDERQSFIS